MSTQSEDEEAKRLRAVIAETVDLVRRAVEAMRRGDLDTGALYAREAHRRAVAELEEHG
jgi:signal transduction histidine kinase